MWEVFGPILRWPLYSRARFCGCVAGLLAVLFVVGTLDGADDVVPLASSTNAPRVDSAEPPSAAVPAAGSPASAGSASALPPDTDGPAERASGASDDVVADPEQGTVVAAADAAAAFVTAWARPDLDPATWTTSVRPLATGDLWTSGLSKTAPSSTPAVTVRGEPVQVGVTETTAVFDVPTTGPWIRVHLVARGGAWLVSDVEPAP